MTKIKSVLKAVRIHQHAKLKAIPSMRLTGNAQKLLWTEWWTGWVDQWTHVWVERWYFGLWTDGWITWKHNASDAYRQRHKTTTTTTRTPAFWVVPPPPPPPPPTHTHTHTHTPWLPMPVIHIRSQVKARQSKKFGKNSNFARNFTRDTPSEVAW